MSVEPTAAVNYTKYFVSQYVYLMVSLLSPIAPQIFANFMKQVNYLYFLNAKYNSDSAPAQPCTQAFRFALIYILLNLHTVCFAN